jgi:NAD(P)H dehydrogenase (quinone)
MIAITGATGKLGRLVVDELLAGTDPSTVVATARSVERLADIRDRGAEARRLDYDDPVSITTALDGVDQLLLVSSSELGSRVRQHANVIDGAVSAGVGHIAYTSLVRADSSTMMAAAEHKATEELLAAAARSSDLQVTLLRHGWYIENYTENLGPILDNNAVIGAAGDGVIAGATRADFAAADAAVLLDRTLRGGTYELGGQGFTLADLALAVGRATGREIPYIDMPADQLRGALAGAGLPEPMVEFLVDSDLGIAAGQLDVEPSTLERLIGRTPSTLDDAVRAQLGVAA